MGFCTFGTIVTFFHLQEKISIEEDKLLDLDLLWKNTPYGKIREFLAAWNKELTYFGPPVITNKTHVTQALLCGLQGYMGLHVLYGGYYMVIGNCSLDVKRNTLSNRSVFVAHA